MTGKLAEKLPLTMSSLINAIPDSLYPEEDIPTSSMNIFTSTDSVSHYSQMNTGNFDNHLSVICVEELLRDMMPLCVVIVLGTSLTRYHGVWITGMLDEWSVNCLYSQYKY